MLRQHIKAVIFERRYYPTLRRLTRLFVIIGIGWILTFPFISKNVFTSENALNGEFLEPRANLDTQAYTSYRQILDEVIYSSPSISLSSKQNTPPLFLL